MNAWDNSVLGENFEYLLLYTARVANDHAIVKFLYFYGGGWCPAT